MTNEIELKKDESPTNLIRMALSSGTDLQDLKELLALQKDWEANEAKKAYHKAMSDFKSVPIEIEKDIKVGYSTAKGKVGYTHASLANVVRKISAELSKHGLSASWRTQQNGKIVVTCRITHEKGHSEETSLSANADDSGSKNSIQAIGSTITYLERYTLLAMTGLATSDMDDDGKSTVEEKLDENKIKIIKKLMVGVDENKFFEYMGVKKIDDILKSNYTKAKTALEARNKGKR